MATLLPVKNASGALLDHADYERAVQHHWYAVLRAGQSREEAI